MCGDVTINVDVTTPITTGKTVNLNYKSPAFKLNKVNNVRGTKLNDTHATYLTAEPWRGS